MRIETVEQNFRTVEQNFRTVVHVVHVVHVVSVLLCTVLLLCYGLLQSETFVYSIAAAKNCYLIFHILSLNISDI